ncbi:hypothetical protein S40293_03008 [Stachybotrys chartarum IBT 40293]|nr:hypothetical protein S40293_03008 [Stachybotrys chartarum IBT 40293]
MRLPGPRAISTAALVPRIPAVTRRRPFHSSSVRLDDRGNGANKPTEDSLTESAEGSGPQSGLQTPGGRLRGSALSSQRIRQAKQRVASALPPVQLPQHFLDTNVSLYDPHRPPRLPEALKLDALTPRASGLHSSPKANSKRSVLPSNDEVRDYFDVTLEILLRENAAFMSNVFDILAKESCPDPKKIGLLEKASRISDMIIESARHLVGALYPVRQPEYLYKDVPFWWWHFYKSDNQPPLQYLSPYKSEKGTGPSELSKLQNGYCLRDQLRLDSSLEYPLAHAIPDISPQTFFFMQTAIARDLNSSAPANFDPKTSKRPIPIFSLSGYGGKAISQSFAANAAYASSADLIHVDAYDVSEMVGDYLGQNLAYARGPISMLGFRVAELNGKLSVDPETTSRAGEEDDDDVDIGFSGVRSLPGSLEDEIQKKLKQRGADVFSKWESLKIDKILDQIIRSTPIQPGSASNSKPVLIHIHDIVEMSMTLEGSVILARLRALVDEAWHQGMRISIFGTSACEEPSEEYLQAVRDLTFTDLVLSRHIQPEHAVGDGLLHKLPPPGSILQSADYTIENVNNANRMLRALDPDRSTPPITLPNRYLDPNLGGADSIFNILRESILTVPELYNWASVHIAEAASGKDTSDRADLTTGLMQRFNMGSLRQDFGQVYVNDRQTNDKFDVGEGMKNPEDAKADARAGLGQMKLNDYEKRIAGGQVHRDKLRVSFSDVHAPPETISALKLLTSLALVRPDAFSYGVLASDRIPGCLLYGPPGTGKTMLAKAVAKESGANMLEISGASINDKWVGESEKLIRAVFTVAKKLSPCVVFIDEADSLLANRGNVSIRASHRDHINQFLKEWDGLEETSAFIMVATNRPFDLDEAVLRRLPRKILVDLPLETDRAAILRLLLKEETLDGDIDLDEYAARTPYYSGSDLKNVCVAAAMAAVEEENVAASEHTGPEPYQYPARRVLRKTHFEKALRQIPASISEDMSSLKAIRKFDEEYGNRRRGTKKKGMGFGILDDSIKPDAASARIRP